MWQLAGGVLLGLFSSLHCVGMCGPLAMALPVQHLPRVQQIASIGLYHGGRVVTYALAGALFGLAGRGIYLAGFQQWFSVIIGMVLLYTAFCRSFMPPWLLGFYSWVQAIMRRLLQWRRYPGFLMLGMANGLLPCGMVYLAVAGALSAASFAQGVLFMVAFGAGTLPAMMAVSYFGVRLKLAHRAQLKKWMPYAVGCIALLFIVRGMNLGIPFVSPALPPGPQQVISCH